MQADGLILAGGKSSRMGGEHKGNLTYGGETFTQILVKELNRGTENVWLSYGENIQGMHDGCKIVQDIHADCGPIGGLHAGLKACENDCLLVAACDMPFLKIELYRYLYGELCRKERTGCRKSKCLYGGVVPTANGRRYPLAGIYRKSNARILEEQIEDKNYRLQDAFLRLDILSVDVMGNRDFMHMLRNINTWQDYGVVRRGEAF